MGTGQHELHDSPNIASWYYQCKWGHIYIYAYVHVTYPHKTAKNVNVVKLSSADPEFFSQGVGGVRMKNMLTHVINSVFRNIQKLNKLITLSLIFGFFLFSITLMGWECNYKSPLLDCQTPSVIELSLPRDEYDFSSHLFIYLFSYNFNLESYVFCCNFE